MKATNVDRKLVITWILVPIIIISLPIVLMILNYFRAFLPSIIGFTIFFLNSYIGVYYMGAFSICFLGIYLYFLCRTSAAKVLFVISLSTLFVMLVLVLIHNLSFGNQFNNALDLQEFINSIDDSNDLFLKLGFSVQLLLQDGRFHGLCGIIFGLISCYCTVVAARSDVEKEVVDISRDLVRTISLLSIIISIMIFAAQSAQHLYTLRHTYAISSLFLGVLFFTLGIIIKDRYRRPNFLLLSEVLLISFVVGFIFGSTALPFIESPITNEDGTPIKYGQSTLYFIPPGVFFFMYMSVLIVCHGLLLVLEKNLPIHETLRKLFEMQNQITP